MTAEAMLMGIPVVRTLTEGARAQIEEGRTGVLVPVDDALALREGVSGLLHMTEEDRREMGARARERALLLFTKTRMVDETFRIYEELVARRS
ncbi:hypothetical protein BJF81_14650 [Ornithinimicrobium sp. CNJ-824]|uniref:glycosyltransferase n=1 Tax=Ornithinimicrobium sp. CNJ-824 TaxID=1904966 RepID=UPI000961FF98|nr:glycosyltransferase [Ornithinimicrobium sp. CNJ-824]OLT21787.1 hypothetical protein BJF81_14650 [Ornithinimicrobium sp. CNJ-824]